MIHKVVVLLLDTPKKIKKVIFLAAEFSLVTRQAPTSYEWGYKPNK